MSTCLLSLLTRTATVAQSHHAVAPALGPIAMLDSLGPVHRSSRPQSFSRVCGNREDVKEFHVRPTDEVLAQGGEPPIGAHLLTPRRVYTHHGIYMGGGRVAQYGGLSHGLRRGPVEEVSLSQFAQGREIWIRWEAGRFSREDVTRRARLRLGENRYHLLTNNCEHFCEWCVRGEPRSFQVDELTAGYSLSLIHI